MAQGRDAVEVAGRGAGSGVGEDGQAGSGQEVAPQADSQCPSVGGFAPPAVPEICNDENWNLEGLGEDPLCN